MLHFPIMRLRFSGVMIPNNAGIFEVAQSQVLIIQLSSAIFWHFSSQIFCLTPWFPSAEVTTIGVAGSFLLHVVIAELSYISKKMLCFFDWDKISISCLNGLAFWYGWSGLHVLKEDSVLFLALVVTRNTRKAYRTGRQFYCKITPIVVQRQHQHN